MPDRLSSIAVGTDGCPDRFDVASHRRGRARLPPPLSPPMQSCPVTGALQARERNRRLRSQALHRLQDMPERLPARRPRHRSQLPCGREMHLLRPPDRARPETLMRGRLPRRSDHLRRHRRPRFGRSAGCSGQHPRRCEATNSRDAAAALHAYAAHRISIGSATVPQAFRGEQIVGALQVSAPAGGCRSRAGALRRGVA